MRRSQTQCDACPLKARFVTTLTPMIEKVIEAPATYPASEEFAAKAHATADLYWEAEVDQLGFWAKQANRLSWQTPFSEVLDWSEAPFAKWFVGGKLNVAYNCVDRHVETGNGDRVAIHWEGEPVGDSRSITYAELLAEVCRAADALTDRRIRRCATWPVSCAPTSTPPTGHWWTGRRQATGRPRSGVGRTQSHRVLRRLCGCVRIDPRD
jgi:hypothetical protein